MKHLYVHIPFCDHICTYCDFCKVFYKSDWADQYLDALAYEIKDKQISDSYETIYIGGGTPSSLSINQMTKLFELLKPYSQSVKEYTIEVNPESMNQDKLKLMKEYGINRVSIGVQSFHDDLLDTIGRHHTSIQAIEIIKQILSIGINDINVDLIYGLPGQTLEHIKEDINIINELNISHVSIYSLILEDHTQLKNQNYQPLSDEEDAYWYQQINDLLKDKGFNHYEVSNYYKTKPSYHNLAYWKYHDYQGIGLGAHSLNHHHRYENTNSLTQYFNHDYLKEDIILSNKDEEFETIMMGLRLIEGLSIDEMNQRFNIDFINKYKEVIDRYQKLEMLEINDENIRTTSKGMNYLNSILIDFIEE